MLHGTPKKERFRVQKKASQEDERLFRYLQRIVEEKRD